LPTVILAALWRSTALMLGMFFPMLPWLDAICNFSYYVTDLLQACLRLPTSMSMFVLKHPVQYLVR
jgi:hypothetical protein